MTVGQMVSIRSKYLVHTYTGFSKIAHSHVIILMQSVCKKGSNPFQEMSYPILNGANKRMKCWTAMCGSIWIWRRFIRLFRKLQLKRGEVDGCFTWAARNRF